MLGLQKYRIINSTETQLNNNYNNNTAHKPHARTIHNFFKFHGDPPISMKYNGRTVKQESLYFHRPFPVYFKAFVSIIVKYNLAAFRINSTGAFSFAL